MGGKKDGKYVLETPDSQAKEFVYAYSKVYDTTTTLTEKRRLTVKRGIFLDVFPLDGLADSLTESKRRFRKIDLCFNVLLARTTSIRKGRSFLKNAAVVLMRLVPDWIINNKSLQQRIDNLCKEDDFDGCTYGGNLLGAYRFKEIMDRSILGKPTLYSFENISVYGPEHYDEYLTHLYGDWRKLPPIEQRVTHHMFTKIDLKHSYLD